MKLRNKLIISFCIMVILPALLCLIVVGGLFRIQSASINQSYDVETGNLLSYIYSPAVLMGKVTEGVYDEIMEYVDEDPSVFDDQNFLNQLEAMANEKLSYIVVRKNGDITFKSDNWTNDELQRVLPDYDEEKYTSDVGIYKGGNYETLIKQVSFKNANDDSYSVYILTSLNQTIPEMRYFVVQVMIAILTILVAASLLLNLWIYSSIVRPVNKLKLATHNIKEGNFDFEMPNIAHNEIGDVCRDFEEMRMILKQSAEDKINSDKEEKELIRNISHDLKTPLTAIKGYVEGIMDGIADTPEKQEKYLRTIANKVNDMDKLIDELTIYSKLDTNRVPYTFNKINTKKYFDDCCDEIKVDLEAQGITLDYKCYAGDDVYIVADAEQLKRVINNIVSNSVKYMQDGREGHIEFHVYDEGDYVHIQMTDNGKGIGINELPHVFERFYRTDSSRNSKQGGSGIGLAIVKKIIEDHKGKIWAESVEGEGTTMHIDLKKYVTAQNQAKFQ